MTTIVTITNEGPEACEVRYYKEDRNLSDEVTTLQVGESTKVTCWNGNLPVIWAIHDHRLRGNKFHAIPPAYSGPQP